MAPWDPIRDAVQANPAPVQKPAIIPRNPTSQPRTPPVRQTALLPSRFASSTPQNSSFTLQNPRSTASVSPTTHRSTNLAMLLNDATTYRDSSPSPVLPSSRQQLPGGMGGMGSPSVPLDALMNPVSTSPNRSKSARSHASPSPSRQLQAPGGPSGSVPTISRSTSANATAQRQTPPPPQMRLPPPTAIPYNPRRITPPSSVLLPLTNAERRTFGLPSNSLRSAMALRGGPAHIAPTPLKESIKSNRDDSGGYFPSQPQASTSGRYSPSQPQTSGGGREAMDYEMQRKRKRDDGEDVPRPAKRQTDRGGGGGNNDALVAHHYNARPEVGVHARVESPIFGLKVFNNWVKSVLFQKMAQPALTASPSKRIPVSRMLSSNIGTRGKPSAPTPLSGRVLDIGCGKGGDLRKWHKARIRDYVGLDIATVSINQARERWEKMKGEMFDAFFAQSDCYSDPIAQVVPPQYLADQFDVVTMQFCMHYAFETEWKVRVMLDNVSRYLRPGGRFVGTIPNWDTMRASLEDARERDPNALTFGNSVYQVRFDSSDGPVYGHRYTFFLQDAVGDVPEYVVYWDNFVAVAEEYGLRPIYKEEFHNIYTEEEKDPEFGALLKFMKVVDHNGESAIDEEQWEAANVYLAFAFEKFRTTEID